MLRRMLARYLVGLTFLLSAAVPTVSAASPGLGSSAPSALPASVSRNAADPAVDGPGHHFGITQASVVAQVSPVPLAGLVQLPNIAVPGWSTANPPSFDIQSYDPVRSIMYIAARNPASNTVGNSGPGLLAIDTTTNTLIGTLSVPDCNAVNIQRNGFQCPSGVSVMSDLRKVAVTSRGEVGQNFMEIFDISRSPTSGPMLTRINLPSNQLEPDELDYDPANHPLFVANTNGSFFQAVIDGLSNTLLGQIPLAPVGCVTTMEQPRYNPVDGMIYHTCSADSLLLRTDPSLGPFGQVVSVWSTPCQANGIDIDPLSNQALSTATPGRRRWSTWTDGIRWRSPRRRFRWRPPSRQ